MKNSSHCIHFQIGIIKLVSHHTSLPTPNECSVGSKASFEKRSNFYLQQASVELIFQEIIAFHLLPALAKFKVSLVSFQVC